jgi:hypothetical protein
MNICYLIIMHHKFEQAARMIRRLAASHVSFVIHVDSRVDEHSFQKLKHDIASVHSIFFARRQRAKWGSYGLLQAMINCIDVAVANCSFDRCVLLSGQDYPIKSNQQIVSYFQEHPRVEFIEAFPKDASDAAAPGWSPYYRFRRYHVWIGHRRRPLPFLVKPPPDFPIYHGSAWWALSRDAVLHLHNEFSKNKKYRRAFRRGFLVEEACLQTMMMNSPFSGNVAGQDTTLAEWTPTSGPHPKVLEVEDFEKLNASPKLFARKFDANVDAQILDMLDAVHV